ncbi:hypothetical protein PN462_19425 [Spirulina sp. CS-785/01]|uniref:hypothetical protein n=1 Tax=Spirulina sp. CS-785/01 TaxID=3021716 RepID=UPI00232DEC10|nr:hypothetical protein [Spirulina sp. CS-785/01]MDB9315295.1 hypothetical protein [Spirulina sp. CS-785/01]
MNRLQRTQSCLSIALASLTQDVISKQGLSHVTVKIDQAPDLFMERLITGLLGLPSSWCGARSPPPRHEMIG